MIQVKISESTTEKDVEFFGDSPVVIKYKPPGHRVWQSRHCADDPQTTRVMLLRMIDEIMRIAFGEETPPEGRGSAKARKSRPAAKSEES